MFAHKYIVYKYLYTRSKHHKCIHTFVMSFDAPREKCKQLKHGGRRDHIRKHHIVNQSFNFYLFAQIIFLLHFLNFFIFMTFNELHRRKQNVFVRTVE